MEGKSFSIFMHKLNSGFFTKALVDSIEAAGCRKELMSIEEQE